jgi:predicted dienelactone hydrolase
MAASRITRLSIGALCFAAILAVSAAARANGPEPRKLTIAGLEVVAWLPLDTAPPPWPIIVFSHGFHGCATQSSFLTQAIAASGYAVFAPNHKDSACGKLSSWLRQPDFPTRTPREWNQDAFADRARDIRNLLDALQHDPEFGAAPFDWTNVGLIGHSLGGYTVLGMAGAWPQWKDPRVRAVLALSPYAIPFVAHHTLRGIGVPVMYQGGTRDGGITPVLERRGGAYQQTPAPKYLVEFDRAGHFAWVDTRNSPRHSLIVEFSLAFLNRYLKGKPYPADLKQPRPGVADLRFQE